MVSNKCEIYITLMWMAKSISAASCIALYAFTIKLNHCMCKVSVNGIYFYPNILPYRLLPGASILSSISFVADTMGNNIHWVETQVPSG